MVDTSKVAILAGDHSVINYCVMKHVNERTNEPTKETLQFAAASDRKTREKARKKHRQLHLRPCVFTGQRRLSPAPGQRAEHARDGVDEL